MVMSVGEDDGFGLEVAESDERRVAGGVYEEEAQGVIL